MLKNCKFTIKVLVLITTLFIWPIFSTVRADTTTVSAPNNFFESPYTPQDFTNGILNTTPTIAGFYVWDLGGSAQDLKYQLYEATYNTTATFYGDGTENIIARVWGCYTVFQGYFSINTSGNFCAPILDENWPQGSGVPSPNPDGGSLYSNRYVTLDPMPPIPLNDTANYNAFFFQIELQHAQLLINSNSFVTKGRHVSIERFDGSASPVTVGNNFTINWQTDGVSPNGGVELLANIPGSSPFTDIIPNWDWVSGSRTYTATAPGTATFTLIAKGYGNDNWSPGANLNSNATAVTIRTDDASDPYNFISFPNIQINIVPSSGSPPDVDLKYNGSNGPVTVTSGTSGTLSWTTTDATYCDASLGPSPWRTGGPGDVKDATGGSESTGPITASATYQIYCENAYGTDYDSVNINVSGAPLPPPPTVTLTFNGSGSPEPIISGSSGTLDWTVSGGTADSCTASGAWSGTKNTAGGSEGTGSINSTRTYTLTCSGSGGTNNDSVTVTINAAAWACNVSANPNTGPRPLNGVDVTVNEINNTCGSQAWVYIDCTNDGTWEIINPDGVTAFDTFPPPPPTSKTWADVCNYSTAGIYLINVKHQRLGGCAGNGADIAFCTTNVTAVDPTVNNAQYISQSNVPTTMTVGQTQSVSVTMKNTGGTTWTAANSYRLGAQPGGSAIWGLNRVYLAGGDSILPDQSKTFTFNITAPATPGTYNFQWKMLREAFEWFGEQSPLTPISVITPFNYSLLSSGTSNVTKTSGNAFTQNTITETLTSGTTQPVTLSVSGYPSGVTPSISNQGCSPTCTSVITFTVTPSAPVGTHLITVTGSPLNRQATFNLEISGNPMTVVCSASPTTALLGQTVTWTANVIGDTAPYTYSWSGSSIPTSPAPSTNPYSRSYSTIGQKTAAATVTDSDSIQATCPAATAQINFNPTFEEF